MGSEINSPDALNRRIQSIDIVRGIVMIIMALDHIRDLMHLPSLTQSPTDLKTTTLLLFFTRWITYLCAPTFVFLSGASAYLSAKRNISISKTRDFLLKRGLWFILLEFTLVNFALWFDFQFRILMLQVIAAIGAGLIVLSLLLKISPKKIAIAALFIICTHNLLQFLPPSNNHLLNILLNVLFTPGPQVISPHFMFFTAYPLIPWIAIMLLGFSCGRMFEQWDRKQMKKMLSFGALALTLFVIIRFLNGYGDPFHWQQQNDIAYTLLSFFNVTKYPPSLMFDLLFLGIMFLLLAFAEKFPIRLQRVLSVYGKVPLFYYLLHLYFIRLSIFIMVFAQGFKWKDLLFGPFQFGRPAAGSGISLLMVYVVWLIIVILLYPLCKWYGNYKASHSDNKWLRYL
ncbi:MAG TPA: heparan-alpha-glucosaminide N-acetyltransferase domain-containing protein [Chitinophagaceae bacterium]|nr:heparan-alpha-glucosaminide N-acetyltransferase domain-containing protein [Chitinophagaceae bacterium]